MNKLVKPWRVFFIFLRLGLLSFGGPVAHIGYFRTEFVGRRKWLSDQQYTDLVALCNFLPGPASSQIGLAIGLLKGGYRGALSAWAGFTLPSAILMVLFAYGVSSSHTATFIQVAAGLKIVAVAVVAHAVWGMAQSLCRGKVQIALTVISTATLLLVSSAQVQILLILLSGLCGRLLIAHSPQQNSQSTDFFSFDFNARRLSLLCLAVFAILLVLLPILSLLTQSSAVSLFEDFYRVGSLVYGGGHVVLPLLQTEVVDAGLISKDTFLAGYGAAQAVPGPLFTFSAFLGAANSSDVNGIYGAVLCLCAIFLPAFLLVAGTLPFWAKLRNNGQMRSVLAGVNACVVGILVAALYDPLWTTTIVSPVEFILALLCFVALTFMKAPSWLIVAICAFVGLIIY